MHVIPGFSAPRLLVALLMALAGCASTRGSFDDGVYRRDKIAFRVGPIPATWRRIDLPDASVAFRDEPRRASVLVNARCAAEDADTPLASLTAHLLIGTTDREFALEETIPFDAREARHTVARAKLDGVQMGYDVYVLKKDGCTYDLIYVAPPPTFDAGAPSFERFVQGFHTLPGSGAT